LLRGFGGLGRRGILHRLGACLGFTLSLLANLAAPNTQVSLLLDRSVARPGETVTAGLRLRMAPGWHTYWRNPGESGGPTTIEWELPDGITAGPVQWPIPEKLQAAGLTTFVYHDEVVLLMPLSLAPDRKPGRWPLKAVVSWLECDKTCVPGETRVEVALEVGPESKPSPDRGILESARLRLPKSAAALQITARWRSGATPDQRRLVIEAPLKAAEDFLPYERLDPEIAPAVERSLTEGGGVRLSKSAKRDEAGWPGTMVGLLLANEDGRTTGYEVTLAIGGLAEPATSPASIVAPGPRSLALMLWFAFVGGLILNIMPCVLPVIALKILGFVNQSRETPGGVRKLGIVYGVGVLVSFWAMAGLVIAVKAAGQRASWGMQFGNPVFIVLLTTLVLLVALNLFGVFEVTLGGGVMNSAGRLTTQHGSAGAFFNGVLATVLATPCTAPFLGAALGFAFAQPPPVILLIFSAVGVGLALPYVLLSWHPGWLRFLPKPGAWMERFKIAMGFPMLATALWLFTLAAGHYRDVFWFGVFLVIVALAAWLYGEFVQRGRTRKGLAFGVIGVLLAVGYGGALEKELRWRTPSGGTTHGPQAGTPGTATDGIPWQRWSPVAVANARAEGRPVLVDFTADWCWTCKVNAKTSLEIASVRTQLKEINAVALLGDYTRTPPEITDELARFGRAGVPLVLVYPKDASRPPIILPELLTPNIVLEALREAGR
jgi:thiol:disulfide interchange protein DsbD